jgi:hypothetical protein
VPGQRVADGGLICVVARDMKPEGHLLLHPV